MLPALLLVAALPGLSGCVGFWTGAADVPAPAFELNDVDGQTHNLTRYEGRYLLLDFMGTWCGPCQRGVPGLRDLQEAYPDLAILSLSSTDTESELAAFHVQYGLTWPIARDTDAVIARTVAAASTREGVLWPTYALVDPAGRIVFYHEGETLPATLAAALDGQGVAGPGWSTATLLAPAAAAVIGALAFHSPFLHEATGQLDRPRRRAFALQAVTLHGLLGLALYRWGAPATGRVYNVALLAAVAAPIAMWWWRRKGTADVQPEMTDGRGMAHPHPVRAAWSLNLNLLWYALPAWAAVVLAALHGITAVASIATLAAFGAGLAVAALAGRASAPDDAPESTAWLGAAGVLAGAAWTAMRYIGMI